MTGSQVSRSPFVRGWRAVAVNVLSGSVVVMALSSAVVGASTVQVVPQVPGAAGMRVQLGASPVTVLWPGSSGSAFFDVAMSSAADRVAVVDGLRGATVQVCSTAWTRLGACAGAARRLPSRERGMVRVPLDGPLGHLKVSAHEGGPLVLLAASS